MGNGNKSKSDNSAFGKTEEMLACEELLELSWAQDHTGKVRLLQDYVKELKFSQETQPPEEKINWVLWIKLTRKEIV